MRKKSEIRLHLLKGAVSKNLWTYFKTITQPKCPSTGESIKNLYVYHTMKHCSAIKINEVLIHATTWVNVKIIMLSERSQTQKMTYRRIYIKF